MTVLPEPAKADDAYPVDLPDDVVWQLLKQAEQGAVDLGGAAVTVAQYQRVFERFGTQKEKEWMDDLVEALRDRRRNALNSVTAKPDAKVDPPEAKATGAPPVVLPNAGRVLPNAGIAAKTPKAKASGKAETNAGSAEAGAVSAFDPADLTFCNMPYDLHVDALASTLDRLTLNGRAREE